MPVLDLNAARSLAEKGRFAEALSLMGTPDESASSASTPECDVLLIELLHATGRSAEATKEARRFPSDAPTSLTARCEIVRGEMCLESQDFRRAISHLQKAVRLAKASRDHRLTCHAQLKLLSILASVSPVSTLSAQVVDTSKRIETHGNGQLVTDFHIRVGQIEATRGEFLKAKDRLSLARKTLISNSNPYLDGRLHIAASAVHLLATELPDAQTHARAALECALTSGHAYTRMAATANLGLLELNFRHFDAAETYFDQALRQSKASSVSRISLLDSYALLQLARGRLDECEGVLAQIAEAASSRGPSVFSWQQLAVSQTRLRFLMASGRFEAAYEPCEKMIRAADRKSDKPHQVSLRILGSDALIELDRFEEAATLIDEAEALAEDVPLSTFAEIERGRASLIARTIGRDTARRQFERSLRVLSAVGGIAARMDAITSYCRSMRPTNIALTRALEAQPWKLEAVVGSTLPGTAGHALEETSRSRRIRSVGLTDTMALGRLVRYPELLAQEAFILLRESGHVVALANVILAGQLDGDLGRASVQERSEHGVRIEVSLLGGANDAGEGLAESRPRARCGYRRTLCACDGRANRLLRAPVGRVEGRIKQERPDRLEFALQMAFEPLDVGDAADATQALGEPGDQLAARHRQPVPGYAAGAVASPDGERLLQDALHLDDAGRAGGPPQAAGPGGADGPGTSGARPWVNCRYGAHPVAHEHAREVRPEDGGGLGKAAAGLNTIDRGRRCREHPEPLQLAADLPARFIRGDHRTAADRGAERVIRRARLTRRAMDRVDQAAARHRQVILLLQQGRDLPKPTGRAAY